MSDVEPEDPIEAELNVMMAAGSVVNEIAHMMGDYRRALLAEGFDDDVVDAMCIDYHTSFVCDGKTRAKDF